ncbi:hypothetical protein EYF80_015708 [Liparis tanakae]|uniref:Uncharacterized protein n=1 Tax=Liparis tanakae TaxID=230148 RepID=A0A4Z2I7N8_9TELE|nr:hypothetical protein EYF80_015708 [Liparis tanakae]
MLHIPARSAGNELPQGDGLTERHRESASQSRIICTKRGLGDGSSPGPSGLNVDPGVLKVPFDILHAVGSLRIKLRGNFDLTLR